MTPCIGRECSAVIELLAEMRNQADGALVMQHPDPVGATDELASGLHARREIPVLARGESLVIASIALERLAGEESSGLDVWVSDVTAALERSNSGPEPFANRTLRDHDRDGAAALV
jgi:hypothetical protein